LNTSTPLYEGRTPLESFSTRPDACSLTPETYVAKYGVVP
jgi:hypothetical protein